ncbi:RluA family pseudouridine synthase [Treponema pectinovorum]|uniref:RluA family pseudouridine synthase n=1 Tax=Treponema pectinovorum TaxID=164 RepID=UPI003D923D69
MSEGKTKKGEKQKQNSGHDFLEILYEDEYICVVNKPSGLLSVPYPGSRAKTAQSILENLMRKNGTFNSKHRPFAVHRLDRDTSGVMMFALTELAQKKIMDNWHSVIKSRIYRAVAENPKNKALLLQNEGLIDDNLAFNANNVGFVPKENDSANKTVPARTHYKIIEAGETHTLFELSLDTGKKNQIRAHLASKGYPLAGDENYRAKTDNFGRLCLHARTLEFIHPFNDEILKFEVPENSDWLEYVKRGDKNPKVPVWIQKLNDIFENSKGEHFHKKSNEKSDSIDLGTKRLSKKDRAHMGFIEAGKRQKR